MEIFSKYDARISRHTTKAADRVAASATRFGGEDAVRAIDQFALDLAIKQRKTVISAAIYREAVEDYKTAQLVMPNKNEHPMDAIVRELMGDLADVSCRHKIDLHIHGEQGEIYADLTVFTNDGKEQFMAGGEWLHDAIKDLCWQWHRSKTTEIASAIAAK